MNVMLLVPVLLPVMIGFICLAIPWRRIAGVVALFGMILTSAVSLFFLFSESLRLRIAGIALFSLQFDIDFISTPFNSFILLSCSIFGLLVVLYSMRQMQDRVHLKTYYIYFLLTVGFANGAVLTNNLIILLFFWGLIPVTLYLLINLSGTTAREAASKSLIIVGGTDFIMLLGVIIVWHLAGSFTMSELAIPIKGLLPTVAYIFFIIGALGKAGAMPFHTWIPDAAEVVPAPVMAFFPAVFDKLLGIYLLVRISCDLFIMDSAMKILLMCIGAITIVAAVMMALVQKNLNKLLAFHSISQVGYMILGVGTGTPIGIAGGIFHMLNNAIYKSCLFFCSGAVEYRTHTNRLERLGGLAKAMPVTFITCMIAALSISGIPPFNGFVSKWMIYQGTINMGGSVWPLFLVAAMFGSALTLASFIKVLHSVFLGDMPRNIVEPKEVTFLMKIPLISLALLCVTIGIFPQYLLKYIIGPVAGINVAGAGSSIHLSGIWNPALATLLLGVSLVCGIVIYWLRNTKKLKEINVFVGGEPIDREEIRIPGTHFYNTIENTGFLKILYKKGKEKSFDFYEQVLAFSFKLSESFKKLHTGNLQMYIFWVLLGLTVLLLVLMNG